MKAITHHPLPVGVGSNLIYQCAGPRQSGVGFRFRLPFRDETQAPNAVRQFDHEWVVTRQDLDHAERLGRCDQALLSRREQEEREFLLGVEETLRKEGLRLERVGRELVMRRTGS